MVRQMVKKGWRKLRKILGELTVLPTASLPPDLRDDSIHSQRALVQVICQGPCPSRRRCRVSEAIQEKGQSHRGNERDDSIHSQRALGQVREKDRSLHWQTAKRPWPKRNRIKTNM